jgi:hypothetical protein
MKIPQIQITKTDIKMNQQSTDAEISMQQSDPKITMEQPAAIIEMHTTDAEIHLDMSQFWRDVGLKKTGELINEIAQKASQTALEGISRKVSDGRQLMLNAGKNQKGDVIQSIAANRFGAKRPGPYNIKFIPSHDAIKVNIQPGTLDINVTPQQVNYNAQVQQPTFDYRAGEINSQMVQRPDVQVDVIG